MSAHMEYGFALGCKRLNELWQNATEFRNEGILQLQLNPTGREFAAAFDDWLQAVSE